MFGSIKKVLLAGGLSLLALHFLLVLLYVNPFKKENLPRFVKSYVSSFFHQNWSLFVPAAGNNYYLFAEYEYNGFHREEVLQPLMWAHQQNRFGGREPVLMALVNYIHYFEKGFSAGKTGLNGPVKNNRNFDMLCFSLQNYLRSKHGPSLVLTRCILMVEPPGGSARVYFNQ